MGIPRLETTQPLLMFLSGLRLRFHLPTTAAPLGPMDLNSPEYNRRLGGCLGGAEISGPRGVRRPVFAWIELFFHINELPGTIKEFLLATDGIHNQLHGQHSLTWIFARLHPATGVPVCSVDVVSAQFPKVKSVSVNRHQIYGFPPKKKQDQQNSGAHFLMLSSAENNFSAEIPGKTIESAEVHYTKPEDEFRRTIGLNTKFRRIFFSAEVRYTICVVEFRWKTRKLKSAKKNAIDSGSQDPNFPPKKKSADLMPHNRPQQKNGPQSLQRFVWQTNLRLQCKVLSPRHYPTYWPLGGTCDREELAWVTLGKSCGLGDGQYIHPLPWSGPMLFESSSGKSSLSIPFPRPH